MHRIFKGLSASAKRASRLAPHRSLHTQHTGCVPRLWESNSALDPYHYTSGRWLHREEEHQRARYIKFDLNALCRKAIETCPGASRVVNYEKKEGGFNRVFILHLDNGAKVVARVPFRLAGPPALVTHSEVATIAYVRSRTSLPVPEILDWSDDPANDIGTPYIIMKHASGVPLQERWPTMNTEQKIRCVERLSRYLRELTALQFPAFGSLYFSESLMVSGKGAIDIGSSFCIGQHCGTDYWPSVPTEPRYHERRGPNRGPWKDLREYSTGLLDAGYSRLPPSPAKDEFEGTVDEHLRLLKLSEEILDVLLQQEDIQKVAEPTLLHIDFHKRNIFVSDDDPRVVTAIIDWQSASIEPMFCYAHETPDFVEAPADIQEYLRQFLGSSSEDVSDDPACEKAKQKLEKEIDLCQKIYTTILRALIPTLWSAMQMDQRYVRLFRYCNSSWRDGAVALRQEILELLEGWQDLDLPGTSLSTKRGGTCSASQCMGRL